MVKKIIVAGINKADLKGDKGDTGATPDITMTAQVATDATLEGTDVQVTEGGTKEAPTFDLKFRNLGRGEVTPNIDLGNLKKGETYTYNTLQELFEKMLVPFVPASAGSATTAVAGGTYEDGATASVASITINATKGSTNITGITSNDGTKDYEVAIDSSTNKVGDRISGKITFDAPVAVTANRGGFAWSVKYLSEDGSTQKLTGTTAGFTFRDKIYWGEAEAVADSAAVLALANKKFATSVTDIGSQGIGKLTAGKYLFIVATKAMGTPKIKSPLGTADMIAVGDMEVTNASGKVKTFKVFRSAGTGTDLSGCSIVK